MQRLLGRLRDGSLVQLGSYVGGTFAPAKSARTFEVFDPADGSVLGSVPDMGREDVDAAVGAAEAAFRSWREQPAKERGAVLRRWYDLVMSNQEDLATIMTSECGKPLAEARAEVAYAASFLEFFAEESRRVEGCVHTPPSSSKRIFTIKQAVGISALITPWNFPAAMITRKAAPAIAAGCSVVVKPAEATPFTAIALAELSRRAGVPAGVYNVVTCSRANAAEVGGALCEDERVKKLSFTGSTAVGKQLMAQCAGTVKRVSLELGGNAPFIVFDDADLDAAVDGLMASKFRNAGQTCVCANRILVQEAVYEKMTKLVLERVQKLKMGHGLEQGITIGPLISDAGASKVEKQVEDARAKGAKVIFGGKRKEHNFFEPTVITDVDASMMCVEQETFGPLVPLMRFKTEEEAVRIANNTKAGLAAYIYTRDLGRSWRVSEALEYGMVGVNEGIISSDIAPFGGMKESGLGREGSKFGIEEYLEMKYICLGLGKPIDGLPSLP
mmetsp:Transcript_36924/g.83259  ORF Transcript_36924/g.83259 Transcript_36924/m.83259 type:complete len:500 (-) Transcript_36924:75-1574(-)